MDQGVELGTNRSSMSSESSLSTSENRDECTQRLLFEAVKNVDHEKVLHQLQLNNSKYQTSMERKKELMSNPELLEVSDLEEVEKKIREALEFLSCIDDDGNTALHIAIKVEVEPSREIDKLDMIESLIIFENCWNSEIYKENQIPLDLAFDVGDTQIISLLLCHEDIDRNLDRKSVSEKDKTCRDVLKERWPAVYLFYELYHKKTEQFFELAKSDEHKLLTTDNGCIYTFLQCACERGLTKVAYHYLRNLNVDVNGKTLLKKDSPLKIATIKGYYRIVQLFYKYVKEPQFYEPDLLFIITDNFHNNMRINYIREDVNHYKCLDPLFLLNERSPLFDINARGDEHGDIVLLRATIFASLKSISSNLLVSKFLHFGACFGKGNVGRFHTLDFMKPCVLEKHFDDCLKTSTAEIHKELRQYWIQFDYRSLVPRRSLESEGKFIKNRYNVVAFESDLLLEMGRRPQFRELLNHPFITSFLHLKWIVVRKFFYTNLIFYLLFCFLLTLYGLMYVSWSNDSLWKIIFKTPNDTTSTPNIIESPELDFKGTVLHNVTVIFLVLFCLREVLQFFNSPLLYIKSPENWMEIFNAAIGAHVLFQIHIYRELAALGSLTIWGEAVLLVGRHPKLSIYITMFTTVVMNFLRFLTIYGILIFAFALSFCLLFAKKDGQSDEFFTNPSMAIFKIFIMMTGEYEASNFPFQSFPFISHVVFVLFIFLIAIVLLSLLNGLAVGDIAKITSDAQMSEIIYRIEMFLYFEKMVLFQWLSNKFKSWSELESLSGWIRATAHTLKLWFTVALFSNILENGSAYIYPNADNVILSHGSSSIWDLIPTSGWRMNSNIVEAAKSVIDKREREEEAISSEDSAKRCSEQLKRLDELENISECNEKILTQFTPKLEVIESNTKTLMEFHDRLHALENVSERLHTVEQISERNEKILTQFTPKLEIIESNTKTLMEFHDRLYALENVSERLHAVSERNEKVLTKLLNILQKN